MGTLPRFLILLSLALTATGCPAKPAFAPVGHIETFTNGQFGLAVHQRLCTSDKPTPNPTCNFEAYGFKLPAASVTQDAPK